MQTYRYSFNPEGKTKVEGKSYLTMTGYFPKIGKRKTIPIELSEYWISDENPEDTYGSVRNIGRVVLQDATRDYHRELNRKGHQYEYDYGDRMWECFIYIEGYSQFQTWTFIKAIIKKGRFVEQTGSKYMFDIEKIVQKERGGEDENVEINHRGGRGFNYKIKTQRETLENIIEAAENSIGRKKYQVVKHEIEPEPDPYIEDKKRWRIPIIGGAVALASALIYRNK
tara:strand:- start:27592 stop:28269 length:678 start_codon:yes stop_codon:yes gene_type:complete